MPFLRNEPNCHFVRHVSIRLNDSDLWRVDGDLRSKRVRGQETRAQPGGTHCRVSDAKNFCRASRYVGALTRKASLWAPWSSTNVLGSLAAARRRLA